MAIFTPHQSQVGIAVAGGGQAAGYVNESTFVTPGQRALPGALNQLAAGLDRLGGELHERAVKERGQLARAERLAHLHGIQERLAQVQSDTYEQYKLNEAGQVVPALERFVEETYAEVQQRWGHDPESMEFFSERIGSMRLGVMMQGRAYARQQNRLYVDRQWQRDLDDKSEAWARPDVNEDMAEAIYDQQAATTVSLYGEGSEQGRVLESAYRQGRRASVQSRLLLEAANNPRAALKAVGLGAGGGDGGSETGAATGVGLGSGGAVGGGAGGDAGNETGGGGFDAAGWSELGGVGKDVRKWYSPDEFVQLRKTVTERIDARYSEQMKQGAELFKTERSRVEMGFYARMSEGALTAAEVESQRDLLSPARREKFLRGLRGESPMPGKSDPGAYLALRRLAVEADLDFEAAGEEALQAGRVSFFDYRALQAAAQRRLSIVGKQIESGIRAMFDYDDENADPEEAAELAGVLREFDEWSAGKDGEMASDEQKHEMARRLVGERWRVKIANFMRANAPLYLVGGRAAPDIDATLAETRRRFKRGDLTRGEYEKQCVAARNLERLITRQRAMDGFETRTRRRK